MKKTFTLLFTSFSFYCFSQQQGPVIEATYLPVRGTAISEIWDITYNTLTVPAGGQDMVWDYSGQFLNPTDTFKIETFHPNTTPYFQYFPTATHASFLRTPLNNLSDSLYLYYIIDTAGLHNLGGFNIKTATNNTVGYDTTSIINPSEFQIPDEVAYGMLKYDTSEYVTYGTFSNLPIKIKGTKYKEMKAYGYGKLKMPNGSSFNDVLLARENIKTVDSVLLPGSTSFVIAQVKKYIQYSFLRNNTFGSSYLMYLYVDSTNTIVDNGWYSLPADFGSISGTVYDSLNENNVVTSGEAYLYRENSNFSKDDILDKTQLTTSGTYQFDSIPYGQYRVSIRPNLTLYPHALTTYWGDSLNGNSAPVINTADSVLGGTYTPDSTSTGNNIHLQYHTDSVGIGQISGSLDLDYGLGIIGSPDLGIGIRDVIPGVDVIVRKKPGGTAMRQVKTDFSGNFSLSNLSDGNYDLFVDIPGLLMAGTYDFTIAGGTLVSCLDFSSGKDSIHPTCQMVGVYEQYKKSTDLMDIYPNPYSSSTTIKMNITEKGDVLLEVYNVLGEKIHTLDKSQKQAGTYSYNFSAKSLNHSSGMYFVRLTVGNKTSVLKIIEQ